MIKSVEVSYSKDLDRPFFTVSLRGTDGGAIEAPIDTPPGNFRNGFIEANHTISLRTPVRLIREGACSPMITLPLVTGPVQLKQCILNF